MTRPWGRVKIGRLIHAGTGSLGPRFYSIENKRKCNPTDACLSQQGRRGDAQENAGRNQLRSKLVSLSIIPNCSGRV